MRKFIVIAMGAVLLGAVAFIGPVVTAGESTERPNENPKEMKSTDESVAVEDMALAHMLAAYGRRAQDPLALIAAARILKQTPTQDMKTEGVVRKQEGVEEKPKTESGTKPVEVDALLAEAGALAGENATLAALGKWVADEQGRGRQGGPACGTRRLDARSYIEFGETFVAGEAARIVVDGDGDTDLDVYVYDEGGNLIDSDTDGTDFCVCEWTPRWTGAFTIRVENLGLVWNQFSICTN